MSRYMYELVIWHLNHALYEQLGEMDGWATYITALREQNRALRALKEELERAGL
jgi:hypothetical protein